MPTGDYLTITDFTTNEQPQNANDVLFCLDEKIKSTSDYVHWWFELSDEDAYKSNPNLSIDLHRADNPRFAYPGNIGVAVLFFTDVVDNDLFLQEYKQTYLGAYISGWNKFQSYSDRSVRFGTQPIQDRKTALFNQFIEYRAKYSGRGFQASVLLQMGYDAGFMFALAQELREIDATMPVAVQQSKKKKPGRPKANISQIIPDCNNYNLVVKRISEAISDSHSDNAKALYDEIKRLQKENIIVEHLDTRVSCLCKFLADKISDFPCYKNVVENIELWHIDK